MANDFQRLLPALERAGVQLANPYGKEFPEIGPDFIGFNGAENCGHARNPAVCVPWPAEKACGIGDNQDVGSTLPFRTCNGDPILEWCLSCLVVRRSGYIVDN